MRLPMWFIVIGVCLLVWHINKMHLGQPPTGYPGSPYMSTPTKL